MMLAALLMAGLVADDDPLAPARRGKLECVAPDREARTCRSLNKYVPDPDGSWADTTKMMIAPGMTVELVMSVRIKGGAVCGTMSREMVTAAKLSRDGAAMRAKDAATMRGALLQAWTSAGVIGQEGCWRYTQADNKTLTAEAIIGGVERPDLATTAIWVSPSEGYRLSVQG